MPNVSIFHFVSTTTDIRILDRYVLQTSIGPFGLYASWPQQEIWLDRYKYSHYTEITWHWVFKVGHSVVRMCRDVLSTFHENRK